MSIHDQPLLQLLQYLAPGSNPDRGAYLGDRLPQMLQNILGIPQVNKSGTIGEATANAVGSTADASLATGSGGGGVSALRDVPGMVGDIGAMNSMAGGPGALLSNPEARMVLAKTLASILGRAGSATSQVGGLVGMSGQGDTGAAPQQIQPDDGAIKMQMQSLIAAGVPASQAWQRINGDQPLTPAQAPAWGAVYASMGGQNDLQTGNIGGVTPAGPTPPPAGAPVTAGTVNFADLPPDQQALAANEHGSVPPELAGSAASPVPNASPTPPTPGGGGPPPPAGGDAGTPPAAAPAAAPAASGPPTVGAAAAGAPGGNVPSPELNSYMYDLMNPERATQNAIGTTGGPQYGPGFEWLKSYLQPAFLNDLAGGNLTPEGLKSSLTARLNGTENVSGTNTVESLKGFEQQGKEALAGSPGSDLRTLMDRAKAGDTTARDQLTSKYGGMGYMSFLGTQDPGSMGGALAQAIAGDTSKPMAPGLTGVLGNFLGQILTKQVNSGLDIGPNANSRFSYLANLMGY